MLHVTLLGAESTGTGQLAAAMQAARPGIRITVAGDPLAQAASGVSCGPVLLMGLDALPPGVAGRDAADADQRLRQALERAGTAYRVIYGQGQQRLSNALAALDEATSGPDNARPWVWSCDNCSDPQCERRLLSDLLSRRAA